jgi:hypothetical protein
MTTTNDTTLKAVKATEEDTIKEGELGEGMRQRVKPPELEKRLSVISQMYDVDGDGKLDKAEKAMRDMDTDNKGHLSNEKVYEVILKQFQLQQQVFSLKRISIALFFVLLLLAVSTLAMSFAAATLAKDTNVENGNLVSKTDGSLVATRSRGSHVIVAVDEGYVDRVRRRMLGYETADDRRFLQEADGDVLGTVPLQAVLASFAAFEIDGTPISVSFEVSAIKYVELLSGSGVAVEEVGGETWYRGFHVQESPEQAYDVHCVSNNAETCDVYEIGDSGVSQRALSLFSRGLKHGPAQAAGCLPFNTMCVWDGSYNSPCSACCSGHSKDQGPGLLFSRCVNDP